MSIQTQSILRSEVELLAFLDSNSIAYQRIEHPPVYTCKQAEQYRHDLPAIGTKNLFLRDAHHHFYLAMTACEKHLELKGLGSRLEAGQPDESKRSSSARQKRCKPAWECTPGAVHHPGAGQRRPARGETAGRRPILVADTYLCHPLVNTATLVLTKADLLRFCEITGHLPELIDMPARKNVG